MLTFDLTLNLILRATLIFKFGSYLFFLWNIQELQVLHCVILVYYSSFFGFIIIFVSKNALLLNISLRWFQQVKRVFRPESYFRVKYFDIFYFEILSFSILLQKNFFRRLSKILGFRHIVFFEVTAFGSNPNLRMKGIWIAGTPDIDNNASRGLI